MPDHDGRPIAHSKTALLEQNIRVTPIDHWQDVRFLTLTIKEDIDYLPGDTVAILPKNFAGDVNAVIEQMEWTKVADEPISFESMNRHVDLLTHPGQPVEGALPYPLLTLRSLLSSHLDVTAIPKRSFFSAIANYTDDVVHKERLLEFCDPRYLDEYYDYATRPRRSILEVLQEFATVRIPWQEAANVFPALRPRQFSIASGGELRRNSDGSTNFELLVALVKYRTVIKRIREGVCTRYLAALMPGSTLQVVLRSEGRLHSRRELKMRSHLLVGAGTGIAPLRSIICEKNQIASWLGAVPGTCLVFGSRNEKADFFFKDAWSAMDANRSSRVFSHDLRLITAFSRDQKVKVYVQDKLRENAFMIFELIARRYATVVVCGSSGQMPKAVREALVDIMASEGASASLPGAPSTVLEAEEYLNVMEKQGRYKQETW